MVKKFMILLLIGLVSNIKANEILPIRDGFTASQVRGGNPFVSDPGLYPMVGNAARSCVDRFSHEFGQMQMTRPFGPTRKDDRYQLSYIGRTKIARILSACIVNDSAVQLCCPLVCGADVPGEKKQTFEIIDTHTHFYDPTRKEGIPWPGKDDKILYRKVLPDEFENLSKPLGVVGTIVVEASPRVEDNQWLLDLAATHKVIVGVVGRLDPAGDDFEKNLRRFATNPLFRGIRINHNELKAGLKAHLIERCKLLVDLGLTLDVNGGPDMPADVAILATKLPKLRIVINHAANLRIDGKEPPKSWREGMAAAANCSNVYCKVSALVEQTGNKLAPREVKYYRPVLDILWELFGEDRLLFGSNWPVSSRPAPYDVVVQIVRDYVTAKGDKAAAKFFHANSQTAYGWRKR